MLNQSKAEITPRTLPTVFFLFLLLCALFLSEIPMASAMAKANKEKVAEDEEETIAVVELPKIVVSATRTENELDDVAATVSLSTREEFVERQSEAVSDVMDKLPGVDFGGGSRPGGQIPVIRGSYGRGITIMVDGARRNEWGATYSPLLIDPELLASAEVVRGPVSSLYGSGGLGGAMVFRTLEAKDLLREGQDFGAEIKGGFSSANEEYRSYLKTYGRYAGFDGLLALGYKNWGPIDQGGDGTLEPNDGDLMNGLLKLGWEPSSSLRIEASHQVFDKDNLIPNNPQAGTDFPYIQQHHIQLQETILKLYTYNDMGQKAIDARLYRNEYKLERDETDDQSSSTKEVETIGGSFQHSIWLGSTRQHVITYGADFYIDDQSATSGDSPNSGIPDGKQLSYGGFLQGEIGIFNTLKLIPSLRWDRYENSAVRGTAGDSTESHLSPKVSLLWHALPELTLFTSFGEAFRSPSISEMYQELTGDNYLFNFAPNTDLSPEISRTLEVGFRFAKSSLFTAEDRFSFNASTYYSQIKDMIASTIIGTYEHPILGDRPISQYRNVSNARRYGVEVEVGYKISNLDLNLSYSHMRSEDEDTDENLFSNPDKFVAQARYSIPQYNLSFLWSSMLVLDQDYDSTTARRRDGYDVHDLFAVWSLCKNCEITLGVSNIFDEEYYPYFSSNAYAYTAEEGRSFKISVSFKL